MNDEHENIMKCEDIQGVLLDYMARELGNGRSDLVREHLRHCPECSRAAVEIQETFDLLKSASEEPRERLSERHRARILRSITHPILDWIYGHHIAVSLAVAVVVVIGAFCIVRAVTRVIWDPPERTASVRIGSGPPPVSTNGNPRPGP